MKRLLIMMTICLGMTPCFAQNKAKQLAEIRKAYADAKTWIAENGKGGNPAHDACIRFGTTTEVDQDMVINDDTEMYFYFSKMRKHTAQGDFYDRDVCYFIIEKWGANGHTRYREMLFDRTTGKLVFSYMKSESHAGFVVESRYYYDDSGRLIDEKHKVGGKDVAPGQHLYSNPVSDYKLAEKYLLLFDLVMDQKEGTSHQSPVSAQVSPKAERMKFIRAKYSEAKQQIEKDSKGDLAHGMSVIIHDQEEGECPPITTELHFYFSEWDDGQAPMNRCYFVSQLRTCMYFHHYSEYLLHPSSQQPSPTVPLFTYTSAQEEGEKWEWRYYFDENGRCIETKSNHEDTDAGKADKANVLRLLEIFNTVANSSDTGNE